MTSMLIAWIAALSVQFADAPAATPEEAVQPAKLGQRLPTRLVVEGSTARMVWAAIEGERPRSRPVSDAPPASGSPPLKFMQELYYADRSIAADGSAFLLLARSAPDRRSVGQLLGWVRAEGLVVRDGAEIAPVANVPRKVILVDTTASLRKAKMGQIGTITPHLSPDTKGPIADRQAVMLGIYFRYGEADGQVLIGESPVIDVENPPKSCVLGWVDASLTIPFDGRLAIEWDELSTRPGTALRRAPKGAVYRNRSDAYAAGKEPLAIRTLFEEQADDQGVTLPFGSTTTRFPLLPYPDDAEYPETDPNTGNQLLRVAALGGFLTDGEVARNRGESERLQKQVAELQAQLGEGLQILFVIDDTGSMQAQIPKVGDTVEAILVEGKRNPSRAVEVAVAYYNDEKTPPPGQRTSRLADARTKGAEIAAAVRSHQIYGGGQDYRENGFIGLVKAIEDAKFRPHAQKMVIMIGDCGDKSDEGEASHPHEREIVEKLLRPGEAPILFVAVQVLDPDANWENPEFKSAVKAFRTQSKTIGSMLKDRLGDSGVAPDSYSMVERVADLSGILNKKFEELSRRHKDLLDRLRDLQAREFHTKVGTEFIDLLAERDVPIEELRKRAGARVGREGYVWRWAPGHAPEGEDKGLPQMRLRTLVSVREARSLLDRLAPIVSAASDTQALEALRSHPNLKDGGSFEEKLLRPLGLPANSALLQRPPRSVPESFAKTEIKAIRTRAKRLATLVSSAPSSRIAPAGSRFFRIGDGSDAWWWVDLDEELP